MTGLAVNPAVGDAAAVAAAIERTGALVPGHFALRRPLHTPTAVRFRAIGRDPAALDVITGQLAALATWDWRDVRVLSPESAGFFLGAALARRHDRPHAMVETDARRLPTSTLAAGQLRAGDRVVLVNDVGATGTGFEPMLELVTRRGAHAIGALLFAVVGADGFAAWCNQRGVQGHHLTVARWDEVPPGPTTCAGCAAGLPLVPVTEFT